MGKHEYTEFLYAEPSWLDLSGDTNSDPLPPVLIPTPIMPSCYRLSTPLSGSFLVFTSVSRWVCSGSTFVNLDRINPLLRSHAVGNSPP